MKLKVCGMRDPENAQALIQHVQPDWMGLIFYPKSPRFVSSENAAGFKNLPVDKVGVFVNASQEEILDRINLFGLKAVQLHGEETPEDVRELRKKTSALIFKVSSVQKEIDWPALSAYLTHVDYFLFDTFTKGFGGSGKTFDWELLLEYPFEKPFLLSGGLEIDHMDSILKLKSEVSQMVGVDINSRFESAPGMKNIQLIQKFKSKLMGLS
jgi:phosphoribosylanthranilate isomerase